MHGTDEVSESQSAADARSFLDGWIEALLDYERIPGAAIAVIHNREVIHTKGYGFANAERKTPVTPRTRFRIASVTKMLTAIAVMQLRDDGRLQLDDPVANHLDWFHPALRKGSNQQPTIRDLLRHTAGLPCELDHAFRPDPADLAPTREHFIQRAAGIPLDYPVQTRHHYSNVGYALLGEIVSHLAAQSYEVRLRERITAPIGMSATFAGRPVASSSGQDATGYSTWPRRGSRRPLAISEQLARSMAPAGGLTSTLEDLSAFALWQLRVLGGEDTGVLQPSTLQEMHSAAWEQPPAGLGFSIWGMGGLSFVGHQGGCPGFSAFFILCPATQSAVVVLCNGHHAPTFTMAFGAHEIVVPPRLGPSTSCDPAPDARLLGFYSDDLAWSDVLVIRRDGEICLLWMGEGLGNPVGSLIRLHPVGELVYRQIESDGSLGKHYVFEADDAREAVRLRFNTSILTKWDAANRA